MLLCGLPGSGKTTLARQLEIELTAVRMSPDEWIHDLGLDPYDLAGRARVEDLQWSQIELLAQRGVTVIYESAPWQRDGRTHLRERCRALGLAVELRHLDVPVEVLWTRLEARNEAPHDGSTVAIERDDLLDWAESFERPDAEELAAFDPPSP